MRYTLSISGLQLCQEESLADTLDTLQVLLTEGRGPITVWAQAENPEVDDIIRNNEESEAN